MGKYVTYKGKIGDILASYSEQQCGETQLTFRRKWQRTAPNAKWLRFDEVGSVIHMDDGHILSTLPADYKLLVQFTADDLSRLHF